MINNAELYPEAWKIFVDCARKFPNKDPEIKSKWIYGIPNPQNKMGYLYSDCPGKLFSKFKSLFYQKPMDEIIEFRDFINSLECAEGKMSTQEYKERSQHLKKIKMSKSN